MEFLHGLLTENQMIVPAIEMKTLLSSEWFFSRKKQTNMFC